jgi:hypothetical protein
VQKYYIGQPASLPLSITKMRQALIYGGKNVEE